MSSLKEPRNIKAMKAIMPVIKKSPGDPVLNLKPNTVISLLHSSRRGMPSSVSDRRLSEECEGDDRDNKRVRYSTVLHLRGEHLHKVWQDRSESLYGDSANTSVHESSN